MVTIETMLPVYLRAGNPDTPEQRAVSAAVVLRAMRKSSAYSHCDDEVFFQDLRQEIIFGTDYSVDQCNSFRDRVMSLWGQLDARASSPNREPLKIVTARTKKTRTAEAWRYDQTCNAPDHIWISRYSYRRNGKEVRVHGHWRRRPSKTSITKKAA
jgi:hypothetical protein